MEQNDIDLLLSKLDMEQLCAFIKNECANDNGLRMRFLALDTGGVRAYIPTPNDYTSRVEDLIDDFSGRYGYVQYRDTFAFNCAVSQILDEADVAMQNHQWDVALAVFMGVAAASEEILNCGDDSAGELGSIVCRCFETWQELCYEEALPEELKSEIFEFSLSAFLDESLKGWDWWWSWIELAISVANTPDRQERIIAALDNVKNMKDDEWIVRLREQTAQKYKLEIMSMVGTPEEQRKFMYENVSNPDFRKRLLQMAWDNGDYNEVLRLAQEGVSHDYEWGGLVDEWRRWEFKTYKQQNDREKILQLARYFFFSHRFRFGDEENSMMAMYSQIKSIVPSDDWNNYVETLISESFEKDSEVQILYIFTQEKMWDRYMDYIRKFPSLYIVEKSPKEVWTLYKDELIQLYDKLIRNFFQNASNRNAYSEGVSLLRNLIRYGGKENADKIIAEQKARKPRRPALIDELSKL